MREILNVGDQINVPNINQKEENAIDEAYSYYKVLPKEGFYRLKLKLGVEQEQLEILNPGLKESGLKEGMILKIPYNATVGETSNTELQEIDLTNRIKSFNTKHLVIMLPFQLDKVDADYIQDANKEITKNPYLSMSMDFQDRKSVA